MILSDCRIDFLFQLSKLPQAKWLKGTHTCYCGSEDPGPKWDSLASNHGVSRTLFLLEASFLFMLRSCLPSLAYGPAPCQCKSGLV